MAPGNGTFVTTMDQLMALYDAPSDISIAKQIDHISDHYRAFIEAAPFFALATGGPDGPRVRSCGLRVWPPAELKPLGMVPAFTMAGSAAPLTLPPLPANSLRLTFARTTTPASRSRLTTNASRRGR